MNNVTWNAALFGVTMAFGGFVLGWVAVHLHTWRWIARARTYMLKEQAYHDAFRIYRKTADPSMQRMLIDARQILDYERTKLLQQRK